MIAQQRLMDNQKNINDNVSAIQLLEIAKNQRNNNRDTYENITKYELIDRRNRLKTLEQILQMPEITMNDLASLKNQRMSLLNDIDKFVLTFNSLYKFLSIFSIN